MSNMNSDIAYDKSSLIAQIACLYDVRLALWNQDDVSKEGILLLLDEMASKKNAELNSYRGEDYIQTDNRHTESVKPEDNGREASKLMMKRLYKYLEEKYAKIEDPEEREYKQKVVLPMYALFD